MGLARIGHHAARCGTRREHGQLPVTAVHEEHAQVTLHTATPALKVASQLVVPGLLGFVTHHLVHIILHADAHHLHQPLLQDVTEHLCIEASRLTAARNRKIDGVVLADPRVPCEAYIGQQLQEVLVELAAVVDVDGLMGEQFTRTAHEDAVARVGLALVVEARVLIIEAQSRLQGPLPPVVGALVVNRGPEAWAGEVAAQHKRAGVPLDGVLGEGVVDVLLDKLADAVVIEGHRGVHLVTAEETAGAREPVVARGVLVAANDEILGHRVFTACLSQCEIVVDGEILVKRHVVVQILVAGDARHDEVVEGLAHRQTINDRRAAVKTRVVIGNLASFNPLIGVTALAARRDRRHIGHVPAVLVAPLELGSGAEHAFPVTTAAIELVGELATGPIVLRR